MKAGMILDRSPWILFINFNFFDSIRAFKERNGPNSFKINETLSKIINENARLPSLDFVPHTTMEIYAQDAIRAMKIKDEIIDTYSQLPYLLKELNDVQNIEFIYELLEYAILKLHDNFLSFFLNFYIVNAIDNFDPISYRNPKNGYNLLQTAINRQNNSIIQTVYYNCPELLKENDYTSFIQIWNEKYITTIDFMIDNDKSLLVVENTENKKSILFHCIDEQYHPIISMLLEKMRPEHFNTLKFYQCNIFIYAIQSNDVFVLNAINDKVDWSVRFEHTDYGLHENLTMQLHPIAFAVFNDNPETLSYLLSTEQGALLLNEGSKCIKHQNRNFNWAKKKGTQDPEQEQEKKEEESDNSYMVTPLMIASMKSKPLLMKILLYHGADRNTETKDGKTVKIASDFWPKDLTNVPEALKQPVSEGSDDYKRILRQFYDPKTKEMEDLTLPKNKGRLARLLRAEQLRRKKLRMVDYEAFEIFNSNNLTEDDKEYCRSLQSKSKVVTNNFLAVSTIDRYVRQLIQNDSNYALNVLIERINLQSVFDPYYMNLRGEAVDWNNSFIRLCVRYHAIQILNDLAQNCTKNKLKEIVVLETKDRKKQSPMFNATSIEICQILYDIGFEIETKSFDPKRSLIYHHARKKHYKIVQWLIFNGCTLRKGAKHDNVLIEACLNGVYHCLPVLISLCDMETLEQQKHSLLHYAIESCNITTVRILIKNGFNDINSIRNSDGETVLHFASRHTEKEANGTYSAKHTAVKLVYHLLFNLNCDLSVVDDAGNTALHIVAKCDMYRVKLILCKLCQYPDDGVAVINIKNQSGQTPLQVALETVKVNIVQILLKTHKCKLEGMLLYCFELGHRADTRPAAFDLLVKYGAVFDKESQHLTLNKMKSISNWVKSEKYYQEFQSKRDENMNKLVCDSYETFSIWGKAESEDFENKYDENEGTVEFNIDSDLIKDYRQVINIDELECLDHMNMMDNDSGRDKNKEILDLCLAQIDNNDTSQFAESYFNDIIMHYMFDSHGEWEILNTICAASQYEPILLNAYKHDKFKQNINAIICKHKNIENAQLIVESLTFSFGNRYIEVKDKKDNKAKQVDYDDKDSEEQIIKSMTMIQAEQNAKSLEETNDVLRDCVEFIMKETIYEKLEIINTKTLQQKLVNYMNMHAYEDDIKEITKEDEEDQVIETQIEEEEVKVKIIEPLGPKPNFAKYDKMRKVGLTDLGIRQKMVHLRMEEYWIKYYFREIEENETKKSDNEQNEEKQNDEKSKISKKEKEKYLKMVKCGIHPQNVKNNMRMKGYDEETINSVIK